MATEIPSPYDLVPGSVVHGRYRIVEPNRQGGMSTAFRAMDDAGEEEVELQFFPSSLFEDESQARSFASSAGTASP